MSCQLSLSKFPMNKKDMFNYISTLLFMLFIVGIKNENFIYYYFLFFWDHSNWPKAVVIPCHNL